MKKFIVLIMLCILCTHESSAQVTLLTPPASAQQWDVYELTIQDNMIYSNPFWDVTISGEFSGPDAESITVSGFYYDGALWKVRFAPSAVGTWSFRVIYSRTAAVDTLMGSFQCTAPSGTNRGFITVNPTLPHKFKYSDDTPFIPRGTAGHTPAIVAVNLGIMSSPQQVPTMWDSLAKYSINTFRLMLFHQSAFEVPFPWNTDETTGNFFTNSGGLDKYNTFVGKVMDRWFEQARDHDIAIYLCMLTGFDTSDYPFVTSPWSSSNGGPYATHDAMYQTTSGIGFELEKKYYSYLVSRYGAYRNLVVWEYNNEYGFRSELSWLAAMDSLVRVNDPYDRARTVSFWDSQYSRQSPVNGSSEITVTDDHFYPNVGGYSEFNADSAANEQARFRFNTYQKPVMFGELGSDPGDASDSWFSFLRNAYWGAFTGGGTALLWFSGDFENESGWQYNQRTIRLFGAVNKVLLRIDNYSTMEPCSNATTSYSNTVRVFSFANANEALVYINNYTNHLTPTIGVSIEVTSPGSQSTPYSGIWIDATTGDSVGTTSGLMTNGIAILNVPSFTTDVLVLIKLNSNTGVAEEENAPREFALFQNYPNPFNPSTTISFSVPLKSHVTLKVFDILGKQIAVLMSENLSGGSHQAEWNAQGLPSGIYFYRIITENFTESRKMILLK